MSISGVSIQDSGFKVSTIAKSIFFAFLLSIVLLFVFSIILTYTNFPESTIPTVVLTITIISIIFGAEMSGKKARTRGWLTGGITGLTYIILLYIISIIFVERPIFNSHLLVILLISFVSGSLGGIIGINLKKSEKKNR